MKKNRIISSFAGALMLCGAAFAMSAKAEELTDLTKADAVWRGHFKTGKLEVKAAEKIMDDAPGIQVKGLTSEKRQTYAAIVHSFKEAQDWSKMKSLEFFYRQEDEIFIKVSIICEGGSLSTGWLRNIEDSMFKKFDISLDKFNKKDTPDLSKVKRIIFGFGLWKLDTTEDEFTVELAKISTVE
ncbi:MAG: hypothetical protein GY750_15435 [Lentisphaerae bacterium]|nr:hypothetical protein [Lentisphaerota bacterium]MCP4102791.1 hypothetical protein [Lentisphaerota bacterium]